YFFSFLFTYTSTTLLYSLSLHDALPIFALFVTPRQLRVWRGNRARRGFAARTRLCRSVRRHKRRSVARSAGEPGSPAWIAFRCPDRKSTRLNSSHLGISYAVFCLKKKNK